MLIFGLAGGWLADRADRKKVLIITQFLAMAQAVGLAYLTFAHQIQVWEAITLAALVGTVNAFEIPTRQALLVNLVEKEDLINAVSLNTSVFSSARTVGPALAGIIVACWGEATCFAINALSYLATLVALSLMKIKNQDEHDQLRARGGNVHEALQFVRSEAALRRVLFLVTCISLFGMSYVVLLPIFASDILKGDVRTLGLLRAAAGFGALIAAVMIASRGSSGFLRKAIGYAAIIFGGFLLAFTFSHNIAISVILISFAGMCMTGLLSGSSSLIQLAIPDNLRGRIMSIFTTVMLGFSPFGALIAGLAAHQWGAPSTLCVTASICALAGVIYLTLLGRKQIAD
jgi:MFS family permease